MVELLCVIFQGWTEGWQEAILVIRIGTGTWFQATEGLRVKPQVSNVMLSVLLWVDCLFVSIPWPCLLSSSSHMDGTIFDHNVLEGFGPKVHNQGKLYLNLENCY